MSTVELLDRGMKCLRDGLGDIDPEEFISIIIRERFDYTKWRENLYDGMSMEELLDAAAEYEREHPFQPKKTLTSV